jgi:hypothetical protein
VVNFEFNSDLRKFKAYVNSATAGMKVDKRGLLEAAIEHTNDCEVSIDLKSTREILTQILAIPKLQPSTKCLLEGESMNKWPTLL